MEEVKFFCLGADDPHREPMHNLEKIVNDWLKANPNIEITSRQISSCAGTNITGQAFVNCTVVIFFRRKV